jgi:hypothetical protein
MHMRILISIQALCAASALALLVACSTGSTTAPRPSAPQGHIRSQMRRLPVAISSIGPHDVHRNTGRLFTSFDHCPATGRIEYISDFTNNVINIYSGKFAGQRPCGRLSGNGISLPQGLFVGGLPSHDLYVANTGGFNILVFHRGAKSPFEKFVDPTGQYPVDVTVAGDGTVIASNLYDVSGSENGSISTWTANGTFVGNFPMVNDILGAFVTVQSNGTLYFNDVDQSSGAGLLWTGSCPLGACGPFSSTGATTVFPGGLRSADSEDVVQIDQLAPLGGALITYEQFPNGLSCALGGGEPDGMDINRPQFDVYYADAVNDVGVEIKYPSCTPLGTVPGNLGGLLVGVALDPSDGI